MVRDIRFRGKRVDWGGWVIGHHIVTDKYSYTHSDEHFIISDGFRFEVCPNSVGQFICKTDTNDIYEGDILQTVLDDGTRLSKFNISWSQSNLAFCLERMSDNDIFLIKLTSLSNKYVIGNVFDGGVEND